MSRASQGTAPHIRRILVALDASPSSQAALDAAVSLAERMKAELFGLFVEDADLLRAAESPYARQILYPSAQEAPLSRGNVERTLKAQAEQAHSSLRSAAQRAHLQYSFRSVRGQVSAELLAAAGETDLVALGKLGWSLGAPLRLGSTALQLAASTLSVLLLSERRAPAALHLLAYYDASPEARQALTWAAQLAAADSGSLTVLLATPDAARAQAMQHEVAAILKGTKLNIQFRRADPASRTEMLRVLRETENGMFVMGSREPFRQLLGLESLLRESKIAVLLLRSEPTEPPNAGSAEARLLS